MNSLFLLLILSCPLIHAAYFDPTACTNTTPCVFVAPYGVDANNGTSDFPLRTIQQALKNLATATIPTTIVLADGTYPASLPVTFPNTRVGITWSGNNLSLTSLNGAATTFIDCESVANVRGLWIGSGETSTTVISGVTIQNCQTSMGSALAIVGPNTKPIIKDVQLVNNLATNGAGLFVLFASPTLINVNVTGNSASQGGACMMAHNASLIPTQQLQAIALAVSYTIPNGPLFTGQGAYVNMTNMRFQSNVAANIGGAYFLLAAYRVTCTNCVFLDNIGAGSGCIGVGSRSTMTVTNCYFGNNIANSMNAGAISVQQGSTGFIQGCTFVNNTAAVAGGGVAVGLSGMVTVMNSIFDGNQAPQGSILYNDAVSRAIVTGCTTRNNIAGVGGIYLTNPQSAAKFQPNSNTYSNNYATSDYGADYASFAAGLAFIIPNNSTNVGFSGNSPSVLPVNTITSLSTSIFNLDTITLKVLLLDTYGQRFELNSSTQPSLYATIMTLDNVTVSALLVQSTRVTMPAGVANANIQIVGEAQKTYAVQWSVDTPNIQPIRLLVTIKPCAQLDVVTFYDNTDFPICHQAVPHTLSDSTFQGILVISCILIACVLIVQGLTIWYWNTPVFKGSTPLFMSLMLFGAIIGYLATILSVVDVNRSTNFDAVCKSQYWLMGVAFALMFGTLALKTWRIRNIFCNETLTEIKSVSTFALSRILGLVLALEILIHLVWVTVDPLQSTLTLSTGQLAYQCNSTHDTVFLIVNLVYNGLIALVCVIFAYQTRDVASRFNESRQLMIASYNMFVCVIVIAALSLALPSVDARRTVYAVGSLFVITSTWFVLFFPKLYIAIFKSSYNTSTGLHRDGSGKNSNSGAKTSASDHGKISGAKSTAIPSSKSSFNHGHIIPMVNTTSSSSACATPTRSGATSPAMQTHKLALNLGTTHRSSLTSPVGGGSPPFASAIARHLSTTSRPQQYQAHTEDIMLQETESPHIDQSSFTLEPRPSQPIVQGHDILTTMREGSQPAKNFV